ncbi:signal peptidase I [Rhizobiales bacterium GAS191]|nr:signal peptidase I [Rhizobiales bacterium GAS191]
MSIRRRTVVGLALAGFVSAISRLSAATLSDWVESARIAKLFVSAGIPAKSYSQPSTKMMPNMVEGDVVLADLRQEGVQPARGEAIVSWYDADTVYIGRVIGLPGDRIALRAGHLILNGEEIAQEPAGTLEYDDYGQPKTCNLFVERLPGARPYKIARMVTGGGFLDNIAETTVPPGHLYLLGDNRDNSVDSRVASRGPVAINSVIGRIVYRLRPNAGWLVPRETVPMLPKE